MSPRYNLHSEPDRSRSPLFFDMDGTLVNTRPVAVKAAQKGMKEFLDERGLNADIPGEEDVVQLIGKPHDEYFSSLLPDSLEEGQERLAEIVGAYEREEIRAGTASLFEGMEEVLTHFRSSGRRMALVTNGGRAYFEANYETLELHRFFDIALCIDDSSSGGKSDLVKRARGTFDGEKGPLFGDRHYDRDAAFDHGMPFFACLWGFGSRNELSGADVFLEEREEIPPAVQRYDRSLKTEGAP